MINFFNKIFDLIRKPLFNSLIIIFLVILFIIYFNELSENIGKISIYATMIFLVFGLLFPDHDNPKK